MSENNDGAMWTKQETPPHDWMAEISRSLGRIEGRLSSFANGLRATNRELREVRIETRERLDGHEVRLDALEKDKHESHGWLSGVVAVGGWVVAGSTAIGAVVRYFMTGGTH